MMSDRTMTNHTQTRTPRLNRREFLKISAVSVGLLAGTRLWGAARKNSVHTVKEARTLMGTVIHLSLVTADADQGQKVIDMTFAEIERLVGILDHRKPQAALARLNRDGALHNAPVELTTVLDHALAYGALSQGAFDVTVQPLLLAYQNGGDLQAASSLVDYRLIRLNGDSISLERRGMRLTLDGIAKGYIVDSGVALLQRSGFENVLVEAGGDLAGCGQRGDGAPWRVGIRHPRATDSTPYLSTLDISQQAVATSGDYMNSFTRDFSQHHIVDPRQGVSPGSSPRELSSVTVIAPTAMDADALSTTVMVLGVQEGRALLERLPHVAGLLVSKTLDLWPTSNFPMLDRPVYV